MKAAMAPTAGGGKEEMEPAVVDNATITMTMSNTADFRA